MSSAQDLINEARTNPPKPVIEGLLNESEIAGLHGPPEVFKTIFCLQLAEALATGQPFLGVWQVPHAREVYFLETEMSVPALGTRLRKIYAGYTPPSRLHFADPAQLRTFRRASGIRGKVALVKDWVAAANAEVVIVDTANPFFRGKESPNDETTAGSFFDELDSLPVPTKLFVRHNHKRKLEDDDSDAAAKIRGSGQFADVPDLLLELRRPDKRTNEAILSVSKYRHGTKPNDLTLWFDSGEFGLISVPPVIHLLRDGPKTRAELLSLFDTRFGLSERSGDEIISAQASYLSQNMRRHSKVFEIDWAAAAGADWWPRLGVGGNVLQGCISSTLPLEPQPPAPSETETPYGEGQSSPAPERVLLGELERLRRL